MIRFLFYYAFVICFRSIRFILRLFAWLIPLFRRICPKITGDTNYLSTPLITLNNIMTDSILPEYSYYVDIGCGEGLAGLYMRLIKGKYVILHDIQEHFLWFIRWVSSCLFVSKIIAQPLYCKLYPDASVFLCVWTSWSKMNRDKTIESIAKVFPKDGAFISVTYPVNHPMFVLAKKVEYMFAWGNASVYYYYHA